MNIYYHEFSPKLIDNAWFWLGFVAVALMFSFGKKQYVLRRDYHIVARFNEKLYVVVACVLSVIWGAMLGHESGLGILQFFANHLGPMDSVVYAFCGAFIAVAVLSVIFFAILMFVAIYSSGSKHKELEKTREMRRRRRGSQINRVPVRIKDPRDYDIDL